MFPGSGDSYTNIGFNMSSTQPNRDHPLGNPPYPGHTSSNGPNWVDFLTTTYNESFIEAVDLASGGATVDSSLVAPYISTVLSVKQQVEDEYLPTYSPKPSYLSWESNDTLFSIFIGINDIGNSYQTQDATLPALIFSALSNIVDQLYLSGARNFLFLNVPPVDLSPQTAAQGFSNQSLEAEAIVDWNNRIVGLSENLTSTYSDATAFVFDTNSVFKQVLDEPCTFEQTCPYTNTTTYCDVYTEGTPSWYTYDAACGVPVDQYFWLNGLHPTFRIHNATAYLISRQLSKVSSG